MSIGEVVKVTFFTHLEDQAGLFTLDFMQSTANPDRLLNGSDLAIIATALAANFPPLIKGCLAQEARYQGLKIRTWGPTASTDVEVTNLTGAGFGSASNEGYAPRQLSGLIKKRTATPTRRGRGRAYIPFPPQDQLTATGGVAGDQLARLVLLAEEMETALPVTIGAELATFRPCVSGTNRPAVGIVITQCLASESYATQRRRGDFGSPNAALV